LFRCTFFMFSSIKNSPCYTTRISTHISRSLAFRI
jgi:hypothetical protein